MPLHDYHCRQCSALFERFVPLARLAEPQECEKCGGGTERLMPAPRVTGDYAGYTCPVSGKWVEGRRAHEENLARTNCRVLETGEKEEVMRRRVAAERALDGRIEQTVEAHVERLPGSEREALGRALESSDLQLTRLGEV